MFVLLPGKVNLSKNPENWIQISQMTDEVEHFYTFTGHSSAVK